MKSVLFINYEYPPIGAGASNACRNIAVNMTQKGITSSVLTSAFRNNRGLAVENGVSVYRVPACRNKAGQSSLFQMLMYLLSSIPRMPLVVRKTKPDVAIVFFSLPCGPIGLILRIFYKIPFVLLLRGGDVPGFEASLNLIHRILRPVRRLIYRKSSLIIANSEGLRELALRADPGFQIQIINNGVDTDFFRPGANDGKQDKEYVFLFAGRFCEQKNIGTLIRAFSKCVTGNKHIRLLLIGDGPALKSITNQIDDLNLSGIVTWKSWCSKEDLLISYQSAHCFVNPSIKEGMSNAVLETMACGLPVLGGDCIGNRELIFNGKNGFLFDPFDSSELAEKMELFVKDRHSGMKLGETGRKMCCERFNWPLVTEKLTSLIYPEDLYR